MFRLPTLEKKQPEKKKSRLKNRVNLGRDLRSRRFVPSLEPLEERALMAVLEGGNIVVLRVGSGTGSLLATGSPVFLDEYSPSGVLQQSIAMPTFNDGINHSLIMSGTGTSEGGLNRSANGQYLTLAGYDVDLPPGGSGALNGLAVPRSVGLVGIDGVPDVTTSVSTFPGAAANNVRSAATVDGSGFWVSAASHGMVFVPYGATDGNALTSVTSTVSWRSLTIHNSQLYVSAQGSGYSVAKVGTGLPTAGVQTFTNLPGMPITSNANAFFMAHLDTGTPGNDPDTIYLTNDSGAGSIVKYALVSGSWVLKGSVTATAIRGLTGGVDTSTSPPTVRLFGATGGGAASGGGSLYSYTDTTGFNAAPTGTVTTIATAGPNTAFRGVAFAPNIAPVLNNSVTPALNSILEDVSSGSNTGTTVPGIISQLGGSQITDSTSKRGIAVTSLDSTNGVWQYSINGGGAWTPFTASATAARLLSDNTNSRIRFVPNGDYNGSIAPAITLRAWDQSVGVNGGTYDTTFNGSYSGFSSAAVNATLAVTSVNDVPSFVRGVDQSLPNTAPAQSISGWATSISAGAANESGQVLTFNVTGNTTPALFTVAPAVNPTTGTLTFTPSGAVGTSTITLALKDNGGITNGGVDTSASQSFTITFTAAGGNQPPAIIAPLTNQTTLEETPLVFSSGNGNAISFSDADALAGDSMQITVTVTNGTATLSQTTGLSGSGNGGSSFTYTGTSANLNAALAGLSFLPATNVTGAAAANVNLLVSDLGHNGTGGAKTDSATVFINLTPVNDAPSFVKGPDKTVGEDAGPQSFATWATSISAGPADESGQLLDFIVNNDNNDLFAVQPSISASGTLIFTPAPNATGDANVSVQLHDNGGIANSGIDTSAAQTFVIHITPVNDPPLNSVPPTQREIKNIALVFSGSEYNAISISDVDHGGASEQITLTATHGTLALATLAGLSGSGNGSASMTYSGTVPDLNTALNGLTFTPTSNFTGTATVQIVTNDLGNTGTGGAGSDTDTVTINVFAPPSLVISELFIDPPGEDLQNQYVEFRSTLTNNYLIPEGTYLISVAGDPFKIDAINYPIGTVVDMFDLSNRQTGSNGHLVILQKDNTYTLNGLIESGAEVLDNTGVGTGIGFGNNAAPGGGSNVGHSAMFRTNDVNLPHASVSYFLIQTDPLNNPVAPGDNLDDGSTGTLHGSQFAGFTILDSVGVLSNSDDLPSEVGYAFINFNDTGGSTNVFTPDSVVVPGSFTAGYMARSGNTIGSRASDWMATDANGLPPRYEVGGPGNTSPSSLANRALNHIGAPNFLSNALPVVVTTASTLLYSGTAPVVADGGVTVSDTESSFLIGATVSITDYVQGDDELSFSDTATITGSFDEDTGVLTLEGFDSAVNYQAALRTVMYQNNNNISPAHLRTLVFKASDGNASLGATRLVQIGVANTPPALDLDGAGGGTGFTSTWNGSAAVNITDSDATVTDDGANLTSLTATLTVNHTGDVLSATPSGGVLVSGGSGGTPLTLSGSATVAAYQTVLRTITYTNSVGHPLATSVTVNLVANDGVNNSNTAVATINIASSTINGRFLFYNQSKHDGNNAAVTAADDTARATDKTPYIPGSGAATFANISSYSKGINGIMVDIAKPHGPITAADFKFRVGNNNTPGTWNAVVPTPVTITTRVGAGVGGSDRVEIIWANNAIQKQWLEVIVKGNDVLGGSNLNTGLAASNVHFWGNALGDTGLGNSATRALVNATDEVGARNNPLLLGATVLNVYDIDRSGGVNATDQVIIRNNGTIAANATQLISVLVGGPFAPEGDGGDGDSDDGGAVASALALTGGGGGGGPLAGWFVNRLRNLDLNSGPAAKVFQHWADVNSPGTRRTLVAANDVADRLGLDTTLLDSILEDLGLS